MMSFCKDCNVQDKKKSDSYWIPISRSNIPSITGGGSFLNLGEFSDETQGDPFCESCFESNAKIIKKELRKKLKELNLN